ncbi:DUF7601 domain-containing protein [Xylanimonas protaetiae]|uniref:Uncharacterized protein n=1 Tax=Xylanimonas protaetiae TaxID=2509457 RepID=A0A4P6F4L4_9MICO|nr:FctA domain-containing protein [Xylanimonas protaetiae]QAY69653.1 hypothetical protein ET471_06035 [Xylanimonas protaetiae]
MVAAALALGLVGSGVVPVAGVGDLAAPAMAADPATGPVKEADPQTHHEYPGAQDPENYFESSRNPGRIWTDKSVFTENVPVPPGEPNATELVLEQDELAVALSALGATRHVTGEKQVPIDVVLVLDNSYSMVQCVDARDATDGYCDDQNNYTKSRAYAMAEAVNVALDIIARDNPDNKVSLVQFGTGSGVLRSLAAPQKIQGTDRYTELTYSGGNLVFRYATGTNGTITVGRSGNQIQSTNIQLGIYTGMNVLAGQTNVTGDNQRLPNVILFTDGEPTYSSTSSSWWTPGTGTQGPSSPGANQYYGNGFLAAMTAAYQKNRVKAVYDANPQDDIDATPKVYTVGLGINALTTNGKNLALATLNPRGNYGDTSNTMTTGFTNAFKSYLAGGSVSVPVDGQLRNNVPDPSAYHTVAHPTDAAAAHDPTDLRYNDAYYSPVTQDDLVDVFRRIAQQIVDAAPNFPVEMQNGEATTSGYVTFTDPLGPFMRVTDMNRLTFCSVSKADPTECTQRTFLSPASKTDVTPTGTLTTYTFSGLYQANDMYPATNVSNVVVTVATSNDLAVGDVVTVSIPASLLPLRDTRITEDVDGNPKSMTVSVSHPVHAYYKVAPKPGVVENLGNPYALNVGGSTAGTTLAQYVRDHTVGGKVRFYSNDYDVDAGGVGVAKSFATFQPAERNDFYRFARDSLLYSDAAGTTTITQTQWNGLGAGTTIYYRVDVYRLTAHTPGSVVKESVVLSTTKQALLTPGLEGGRVLFADAQSRMTAPAGMRNFSGRAMNLDHVKCDALVWVANLPTCGGAVARGVATNPTGTDPMARRTAFDGQAVRVALGNDGYLEYPVPGRLTITKQVSSAGGLNPNPAQRFEFTVSLGGTVPTGAAFPYSVYRQGDTTTPLPGRGGTVSSGGKIALAGGELAEVVGLPNGATYTVTEGGLPPAYSRTSPTESPSGIITVPQSGPALAAFVNTYAPAGTPAVATPTIAKVIPERGWAEGDSFSAKMCPDVGGAAACETVPLGPGSTTAAFGQKEFSAPGTYGYTITEVDGLALGFSYSGAAYRWVVTVTDDGTGTLHASSALTQPKSTARRLSGWVCLVPESRGCGR